MRQWPMWLNPVPLSLIQCTCVVPLFLWCCVICHMVLIAQCGKVLWLPLRSYHLCNRISQFWFDKLGFERIHSDARVYVLCWQGGNQTEIILILYINNLPLMGNDLPMINRIKKKLGEAYHMKDLGAAQSYLGIRITRDRTHWCIWVDQEAYIDSAICQTRIGIGVLSVLST